MALTPYSKTDNHPFVEFDVARKGEILSLSFCVSGECAFRGLTVIGSRVTGLWEDTCFEFFLADDSELGYVEFNFSPAGDWQVFRFSDYRKGRQPDSTWAPHDFSRRQQTSSEHQFNFEMGLLEGAWAESPQVTSGNSSFDSARKCSTMLCHTAEDLIFIRATTSEMDPTLAFKFGIDTVLSCGDSLEALKRNRFALVAHPASVTTALVHSLDALAAAGALPHCVFGPQHGARGDKQDNMIETEDFVDPKYGIPVHSLYGAHRRPTEAMLSDVDLIVFDLQDVGCRVYTFLTTLHYLLEAAGQYDIPIWVLDRPNPAAGK